MLLELTLKQENEFFGPAGSKVMLNDSYVVGVTKNDDGAEGSKVFVDLSDTNEFITLYVRQAYETWYLLRLNP